MALAVAVQVPVGEAVGDSVGGVVEVVYSTCWYAGVHCGSQSSGRSNVYTRPSFTYSSSTSRTRIEKRLSPGSCALMMKDCPMSPFISASTHAPSDQDSTPWMPLGRRETR